jgi:hypothetical protein
MVDKPESSSKTVGVSTIPALSALCLLYFIVNDIPPNRFAWRYFPVTVEKIGWSGSSSSFGCVAPYATKDSRQLYDSPGFLFGMYLMYHRQNTQQSIYQNREHIVLSSFVPPSRRHPVHTV